MDIIISSATHRSGSTLLQRLFNARKETLIWGEQDGLLTNFFNMHRNLKHYSVNLHQQRVNYFNNGEDPNQWIACMNPEIEFVDQAIINSIKVLFDSLYEQNRGAHDIIGFKEVRYGENELSLFRKCYPDAQIVLLVRNPIDVWRSMLGAGLGNNVANFSKKWNKHASYYLELPQKDHNSHLIIYEKLVNKDPETLETIAKLGKLSNDEINHVLSNKIWSTPRTVSEAQRKVIIQECGEVMKKYGYL